MIIMVLLRAFIFFFGDECQGYVDSLKIESCCPEIIVTGKYFVCKLFST
jgi:hypothetical protein